VIGGGPGTGKTTLTHALAERVGAAVISTDEVRRALQNSGAIVGAAGVLNVGLYSDANVAAVYDEMIRRAHVHLANGRSVILDGSWRDPSSRNQVRQLAIQMHSTVVELKCEASVSTAARRVAARPAGGLSDATPEIATALADGGQQWPEADHIDTSQPLSQSVCAAEKLWRLAAERADNDV